MSRIRYVCVSDLHLGDRDCLLSDPLIRDRSVRGQPPRMAPLLERLGECLHHLVGEDRPTLVLAGDTLEFALASPNEALMVFDQFLNLVGDLFGEIIFLAGNHDHHLWESTRETQYTRYVQGTHKPGGQPRPVGGWLAVPWHTTYMMEPTELPISALAALKDRHPALAHVKIKCVYPDYAAYGNGRFILFTHGHYLEPFYKLGSWLKQTAWGLPCPRDRDVLETDNFAWVDFFWSTLGQTGVLGKKAAAAYEAVRTGRFPREVVYGLVKRALGNGWLGTALGRIVASVAARQAMDKGKDECFGQELRRGLEEYLGGYVWREIHEEHDSAGKSLVAKIAELRNPDLPADVRRAIQEAVVHLGRIVAFDPRVAEFVFVFGHTHKPFVQDVQVQMRPVADMRVPPRDVAVCNLGGWVVEDLAPHAGRGASIVIVDESLNAASIPIFLETGAVPSVVPLGVSRDPGFLDGLRRIVQGGAFVAFQATVADALSERQRLLAARLAKGADGGP